MAAALPAPGLGRCMALTGWRLTGAEALAAGLATHLVPWNGLGALKEKLLRLNWEDEASKVQLAQILREETLSLDSVDAGLDDTILKVLSQTFTPATSAKEIRDRLRALSADLEVDADVKSWVEQRLSGFEKGCPMTQEVVQCLMDQADREASKEPDRPSAAFRIEVSQPVSLRVRLSIKRSLRMFMLNHRCPMTNFCQRSL